MTEPLRIIVMGTGAFAVPMFRALVASRHRVLLLVTQPLRVGRGNRPAPPSPMREAAQTLQVPLFDPESINTAEGRAELTALRPDLFVVADYGQILAPETLAVAPLGGINLHGSLLPKYRGAAPINWCLYKGDTETGVTVIHMTPRVDAGPCLAQSRLTIEPDETALQLEHRLAEFGAPLIVETIERLIANQVQPLEQDPALACGARRLRKTDGEVNWTKSAAQIRNQVRAFEPWPRTSTCWLRVDHPPLRLILGQVVAKPVTTLGEVSLANYVPGQVVRATGDDLWVLTGNGLVAISQVQPAGKKMMGTSDFLRGHAVQVGDHLGPEPG